MDKAKAAVSDFMQNAGHHDTTVHEKVAPAVVNEQVIKQRHEEAQTAIDREVHQDHYHTSVQPVKDREVLPEQHSHRMAAVEEREIQHGDSNAIKARLEEERMQFQNTRTEAGTKETHSVAPVIAGEHVHHHVHETIQPVVQKETIQPSVVHTTVPIHEVHQNEAQHHAASALPAVSMADFKKQGGSLTGREERYDGFEGEPRAVGGALGGGSSTTGASSYDNTGLDSSRGTTGTSGYDNTGSSGYDNTNTTAKKPGLMDKLNPMKDSDGDGKRGVGK
ncbi:MAG: hypothetical protein ASARMPREDX12_006641 [Alectoria sarmentosa]|nr:MAG: hypothetical protein ASARMPRED_001927 [Alectoria sarmentosa]CAD6592989.1 MAG: hypothetical protein ASARMPREDX12_006641 [Alectoria sarmentosa]